MAKLNVMKFLRNTIPTAVHSRSQLSYFRKPFENGSHCIYVSSHTYPELLKFLEPFICAESPSGWRQKDGQENIKYLWFPPNALTEAEVEKLDSWGAHYERCVFLGLSEHINEHFSDELNFCVALDYNFVPDEGRTDYGEAEYQLKYGAGGDKEFDLLVSGLTTAYGYLPLPGSDDDLLLTSIPVKPEGNQLATQLAQAVAVQTGRTYLSATLHCPKNQMKNLAVAGKIAEWERLFNTEGCVDLSSSVEGKTIVVVDDLYQSGATMWCYAKYLKVQGARAVIGLSCVKALRDSDNQG